MTPSQQAKAAGLKSLEEMSQMSCTSVDTLSRWHRRVPRKFQTMLDGCVFQKIKEGIAATDPKFTLVE